LWHTGGAIIMRVWFTVHLSVIARCSSMWRTGGAKNIMRVWFTVHLSVIARCSSLWHTGGAIIMRVWFAIHLSVIARCSQNNYVVYPSLLRMLHAIDVFTACVVCPSFLFLVEPMCGGHRKI